MWTILSTCFLAGPRNRVPPEVEEVQQGKDSPEAPAAMGPDGLTDPRAVYAQREAEASKSADRWRARFDAVARLRMGVTLALAAAAIAYLVAPAAQMFLIAPSVVLIVGFTLLVVRHARIRRKEIWYRELAEVALEARHRRLRRRPRLRRRQRSRPLRGLPGLSLRRRLRHGRRGLRTPDLLPLKRHESP